MVLAINEVLGKAFPGLERTEMLKAEGLPGILERAG